MSSETTGTGNDRSLVDTTRDEHRTCMQAVADVEACLSTSPDREGRWVAALVEKLPVLENTMREHFESEQQGPMFRTLPLKHPRLATRLRRLESEHASLLEAAESARVRAEALIGGEPQPYDLHELNAKVQMLIARIQRHEAEENEVVLEAHWDEFGAGD